MQGVNQLAWYDTGVEPMTPANDNDDPIVAELRSLQADCEAFAKRMNERLAKLQARVAGKPTRAKAGAPTPEDWDIVYRAKARKQRRMG